MSDDTDRPRPGGSFDPRTWAPSAGATRAEAAGGDSFDPRTWTRSGPLPPPPPRFPTRRLLIGLGVTAALGGAGVLVWSRRRAPGPAPATPSETHVVALAPGDDIAGVLRRLGAASDDATLAAARLSRLGGGASLLSVTLALAPPRRLLAASVSGPGGEVRIVREGAGLVVAQAAAAAGAARPVVVRGEVASGDFFTSAVAAGLLDVLVPDFTRALSFDIDFAREVAPGDVFEAVYEERRDSAGRPVGERRLLFAALRHAGASERLAAEAGVGQDRPKSAQLYRFGQTAQGDPQWFDNQGRPAQRGLMRTPIDGGRITSAFGMREHPVLGFYKEHKGVDFGAPVGTAVYAAGDGEVVSAGPAGTYGNFVKLRHSPTLQTAYAHLSQIDAGVRPGEMVRQGQQIALSGDTGRSTGPHLHYEVILDDQQVDPMSADTTAGAPVRALQGEELARFHRERDRIDALRAQGV